MRETCSWRFSLLNQLLELGQIYPLAGQPRTMTFWIGEIAHISLALGIHGFACWEISHAITIRTLNENFDFEYHMPPLVVKTKNPQMKAGGVHAPAGRRSPN